MPLLNSILENKVLAREYKRGLQEGRQEGHEEGEKTMLRRQIVARFGTLPDWAEDRLAKSSPQQREEWSIRLLKAETLEAVLGSQTPL